MTRVAGVAALVLALLAASLASEAQSPTRVPRVGILRVGSPPDPTVDAFRRGLRDLGYVEGQSIVLESRYAEGRSDRLPDLAAELVRLRVDVIVTSTVPAIRAAQQAGGSIPIVMQTADPVGIGLVASLARPGGTITGVSNFSPAVDGKRLELLKATIPGIWRVAFLWDPDNPASALRRRKVEAAAQALGLTVQSVEVRRSSELERAFSAIIKARAGALLPAAPMVALYRDRLLEFATTQRLPLVFESRTNVEAGGLMAYGPDSLDQNRRLATYVDKILKGAKPGDLPVEQPTKFELIFNLRTAKALGLTIPLAVLARADEVIQ